MNAHARRPSRPRRHPGRRGDRPCRDRASRRCNGYILPGYERLADATETLAAEADAACSGDGPIEAAPVKAAFNRAFDAWIGVERSASGRSTTVTPASPSPSGPTPRARRRARSTR